MIGVVEVGENREAKTITKILRIWNLSVDTHIHAATSVCIKKRGFNLSVFYTNSALYLFEINQNIQKLVD